MADSYNELFGLGSHSEDASLEGWWPLQDDAASTAIDDVSSNGNEGTLAGGNNTSDLSTTGPNSWLTSALDLDGSADHIDLQNFFEPGTGDYSLLARALTSSSLTQEIWRRDPGGGSRTIVILRFDSSGVRFYQQGGGTVDLGPTGSYANGAWHNFGGVRRGGSSYLYADGSQVASGGDPGNLNGDDDDWAIGAWRRNGGADVTDWLDGLIGEAAAFSRGLTLAEYQEWENGPEPINSVAPVVSGTEEEDETLSCTTGTWGLDAPFSSGSNGTITYAYQWTRSDDGSGTGESDIGGATSSTYLLTATDVGKFIRCRVRATNDGGFDSSADTNSNFTGAIAAAGGGDSVSATAAMQIGPAVIAASASHTTPTYTASAALANGPSLIAASATHTTPTYAASAALANGPGVIAASASHTTPTYTASAALANGPSVIAASAVFNTVVRTATIAAESGPAVIAASATHETPTYTASTTLQIAGAEIEASAIFATSLHQATVSMTIGAAEIAALATFVVTTFVSGAESFVGDRYFESFAASRSFESFVSSR